VTGVEQFGHEPAADVSGTARDQYLTCSPIH
jgi:hypothetical protein